MAPFSYMMNLFNAPPRAELTLGQKISRIAQMVAVLISASTLAAVVGTVAVELVER